jgi:hypothetical protein
MICPEMYTSGVKIGMIKPITSFVFSKERLSIRAGPQNGVFASVLRGGSWSRNSGELSFFEPVLRPGVRCFRNLGLSPVVFPSSLVGLAHPGLPVS